MSTCHNKWRSVSFLFTKFRFYLCRCRAVLIENQNIRIVLQQLFGKYDATNIYNSIKHDLSHNFSKYSFFPSPRASYLLFLPRHHVFQFEHFLKEKLGENN